MNLGTIISCSYPNDTHMGAASGMDTTAGRCMGGRVSDLRVLHAPRAREAEYCPSKDCTFGPLLPVLSITNSSPVFVQDPLFSIPAITAIFC